MGATPKAASARSQRGSPPSRASRRTALSVRRMKTNVVGNAGWESPLEAGSPVSTAGLAGGDVAVELLLEERPRALALVLPVAVQQALLSVRLGVGGVVEVELAVGAVQVARVRRPWCEVGGDEAGARAAVGSRRTDRVWIEARRGDRADEVPHELALHPGENGLPVLAARLTRAGALTGERDERTLLHPADPEGPVAVVFDGVGARLGVICPRVAAGAVVGGGHRERELRVSRLRRLTVLTGIGEADRSKRESPGGDRNQDRESLHDSSPSRWWTCSSNGDAPWRPILRGQA